MSLPSPSLSAVSLSAASSSTAAAHWQPRWTSPQAPPLLPTATMPSALSSLRPRPRTKTRTSARWWRSKACASAHSQTVPANPPQPPRCCHRAATVALCATASLCAAATAADAAADTAPPPSCRRRRAVALPQLPLTLPQPPRCSRHAVHCRHASRCRHRCCRCCRGRAAAKLPPTSRWHAAATTDVAPLRCRHRC